MHQVQPDAEKRARRGITFLLFGVMLSGSGQTAIFAVLPPMARDLGLADIQVGTIFTLSAILFTVLAPIWGRASDRLGRRPFIVTGLMGYAISMAAFGLVLDLGQRGLLLGLALYSALMLARSLSGIASSATSAAGMAFIADNTPPKKRAAGMASYSAAYGLGSILGPAVAGLLSVYGLTFPLYLLAGLGAAASFTLYVCLPPTPHRQKSTTKLRLRTGDPRIARLLVFALIGGCMVAIPMQVVGFYMLDALGIMEAALPRKLGIALAVFACASLIGQLAIVRGQRVAVPRLLQMGPALVLSGSAIMVLAGSLPAMLGGMLVTGLGSGLIAPAAIAAMSVRVDGDEQGAVSGMAGSAGAIGFVLAPFVGFGLHALDPRAPFMLVAGLAAILALPIWNRAPG